MAIYHLSAKVISRGAGRSVVAAAAYRSASRLPDERTGVSHDFTAKAGVVHAEVLLPEGAPSSWSDRGTLWNAVEAGERRKDAQLAREVEFALPRELSQAEGVALAQDFVRQHFVSRGMVADLCVHAPMGEDGEAKPHAHVLLTLRRAGPEGFGPKERGWNETALLREWRKGWAELANARLAELGYDARIDHRSLAAQGIGLEPQHKVGPAGMRRVARGEEAERRAEHDAIARRNGERLLAEPERALEILTHQQSTFTQHDLARLVARHTDGAEQFGQVLARVEASPELVRLGRDGRGQERLTTRAMLETERRLERDALALAGTARHRVGASGKRTATLEAKGAGITLSGEQEAALGRVLEARDLVAVVGTAGAGKSTLLASARAAWEREGLTVRGAALSGIAAENLETGSSIPSRTITSLEHAWERGRDALGPRDVLVVDEAGLVGSRQLGRVLAHAREAGAKVVLVGDAKQLQAIEAGAAFRAVVERVGAAEVTAVRRQREGWQREATGKLATGRTTAALERYEAAGMVREHGTAEEARAALVAGWMAARQGRGTEPGRGDSGDPASTTPSQVMLAHTRADVADLNARARAALREAGTLAGEDHRLETARGPQDFAIGERVMFLRNERSLGVKNGTLGTLVRVEGVAADGSDVRLAVRLDGREGVGSGREVAFQLRDYGELAPGYATTVHKAQGVTVDRAHVLATPGMDRHMAYVALTRHRDGVVLHWSREEHGGREHLVRALSRERAKDTSLDYGMAEERRALRPTLEQAQARAAVGYAERRGLHPLGPASGIVVARPEMVRQGGSAPDRGEEHPRPLLAAHHSLDGRDSLGRGTTPAEVAAAAGRDPAVLQEVRDRGQWLALAYRDPGAAEAGLVALVREEGGDLRVASQRLQEAGPEALGPLRGRDGLFAGSTTKQERVAALEAARAVPGSLAREARARERAGGVYVAAVEAQRGRDAVEVPGLSRAAWAAVEAVERARGGQPARDGEGQGSARDYWAGVSGAGAGSAAVAEAWRREVLEQPKVARELRAVSEAAERRLGQEGMQDAGRSAGTALATDGPGRRDRLAEVGRVVSVSCNGSLAKNAQERAQARQHDAEQQRLGIRRGYGIGM
nr:Ti-type conjugative transfer relaxase TraA [Roseomonas rosea]